MDNLLACIHSNSKVESTVQIDPFVTIQRDVEIDEGTWIGSSAMIMEGARIGKNCKIYPHAIVSASPQDLKYKDEQTLTYIGDNTIVREFATISRGTSEKYKTSIGKNCLLMAYSHVAHDCIIGDNTIISNSVQIAGHVHIESNVVLGGLSAIGQFIKIGAYAFISGGSLVRKDIPPFIKVGKNPLSYCGVNIIGLQRKGFSKKVQIEIQEIYRKIFLKGYNHTQARQIVEKEIPLSPHRDSILKFIHNSSTGILKKV